MPSRSKLGDETVTQAIRTQDSRCCNQAQKNSSHQSLGILRDFPWILKNGIEVFAGKQINRGRIMEAEEKAGGTDTETE